MRGSPSTRRATARGRRRAAARGLIIGVSALLLLFVSGWYLLARLASSLEETGVVLHQVERGEFVHEIVERGNVESANNVEIKCEVKSRGTGTRILWVIPEGTHVEPAPDWRADSENPDEDPPDLLVRLDSSWLEDELVRERISRNKREVNLVETMKTLETAQITLEAYVESSYKEQKQAIESRIFVAREDRSRARQFLEYEKNLLAKGYVTGLTVERDRFAVEKASKDGEAVRTELRVLEDFTRPKVEKTPPHSKRWRRSTRLKRKNLP